MASTIMKRLFCTTLLLFVLAVTSSAAARTVADDTGAARGSHVVTLRGTLRIVHSDNFRNGASTKRFVLFTPRGPVRVDSGNPSMLPLLGRRVELTGRLSSSGLALHTRALRVVRGGVRRRLATVSGQQKLLVLLVNFTNDRSQPWTPAEVGGVVFSNANSVASYYSEESSGRITVTGDVRGWFELPYDNSGCSYTTWGNAANSLAQSAGINLSAYTNIQYVYPPPAAAAGRASRTCQVRGRGSTDP
jgi:hypothetical protein